MANCHELFQSYFNEICIGSNKKNKMITSKNKLRDRIRKWFKDNHPEYEPKFYIQGSHKMKNGIRTEEDICDLDDGVYFFRQPDVTATTLQGWIWDAVEGYTDTTPEHRKKCIRSIFAGDYEIDHPVYYKIDNQCYRIAVKDVGFEDSDPKAMIDWFNKKKDKEGKLLKHTMNLKGWGDQCEKKMPSGLAMTILASNAKENIVLNDRDDIALKDLLREIKKALYTKFECVVPVTPKDDLFSNYTEEKKNNFLKVLEEFINDAEAALKEKNQLKASKLWQKHLGSRFPDGENKDEENNSRILTATAIGASKANPWVNE